MAAPAANPVRSSTEEQKSARRIFACLMAGGDPGRGARGAGAEASQNGVENAKARKRRNENGLKPLISHKTTKWLIQHRQ
jgi:hypothetical protein